MQFLFVGLGELIRSSVTVFGLGGIFHDLQFLCARLCRVCMKFVVLIKIENEF